MRRREVIALFGSALTAYPATATAQQTAAMRRVGVLTTENEVSEGPRVAAFRQGLAALGWSEGRNLILDVQYGRSDAKRVAALAAQLVKLKPNVFFATNSNSLIPLQKAAGSIPIVFASVTDPVGLGFVRSLAHPGGTITGIENYDFAMAGKWLQLLKEIAPRIRRTAVLYDPGVPSWQGYLRTIEATAQSASVKTAAVPYAKSSDVTQIAAFGPGVPAGVIALPGALDAARKDALVKVAAKLRLPVIAGQLITHNGGLMSYTDDYLAEVRLAAGYVDRILRGEKPADLPVQRSNEFILSINLKTAKTLGLVVPQALLISANELIR